MTYPYPASWLVHAAVFQLVQNETYGERRPTALLRVGFESHEARAIRRTRSMTEAA